MYQFVFTNLFFIYNRENNAIRKINKLNKNIVIAHVRTIKKLVV